MTSQAAGRTQAPGSEWVVLVPDLVSGGQSFAVVDDREKLWPHARGQVIS